MSATLALLWLLSAVNCRGDPGGARPEAEALTAPELGACLDLRARLRRWLPSRECGTDDPPLLRCAAAEVDARAAQEAGASCAVLAARVDACAARGGNASKAGRLDAARLVYDLAVFSAHVGGRGRLDAAQRLLWKAAHDLRGLLGRHVPREPISDLRGPGPCPRSGAVIGEANGLYLAQGFEVISMFELAATFLRTARGIRVLPEAARRVGCEASGADRRRRSGMLGPEPEVCGCLHPGQFLHTGWGIMDADVELFVNLQEALLASPARRARVFAIGNAFGFSSVVLGLLFARKLGAGSGLVDVIDSETEAGCNHVGSLITRSIANASDLDIALSVGLSPRDVPHTMRAPAYDLAFIDGEHTERQLQLDFGAVAPRLAARAAVVLHDVGFFGLHAAVAGLPPEWRRHPVRGRSYKNLVGTVLLHRGFPAGTFDHL
uniref:Uncharacterized protein n=1 Tax=Alexandrium monilatum TaxID=311494 RepID=A0A7S4UR10_9DINO